MSCLGEGLGLIRRKQIMHNFERKNLKELYGYNLDFP